ncbi:HET-domain-containing protein, partial [Corynespora cassiicola Philippines]
GIPLSNLPRTFREAVVFTRQLNIIYLWIDSLCIIQDSHSDWSEQSSQMSTIYANSHITLAASAAPDSGHGLFLGATPEYISTDLTALTHNNAHSGIQFRKKLPHGNPQDNPLMTRGWAFQELLLSPRVIYFCRNEVVWECREHLTCECGALSSPAALESLSKIHLAGQWHRFVEEYSRLRITVQSDVLPAIAGVAAILGKRTDAGYIAGLWKENLVWDMCWMTREPEKAKRPNIYRAPSFSWA